MYKPLTDIIWTYNANVDRKHRKESNFLSIIIVCCFNLLSIVDCSYMWYSTYFVEVCWFCEKNVDVRPEILWQAHPFPTSEVWTSVGLKLPCNITHPVKIVSSWHVFFKGIVNYYNTRIFWTGMCISTYSLRIPEFFLLIRIIGIIFVDILHRHVIEILHGKEYTWKS